VIHTQTDGLMDGHKQTDTQTHTVRLYCTARIPNLYVLRGFTKDNGQTTDLPLFPVLVLFFKRKNLFNAFSSLPEPNISSTIFFSEHFSSKSKRTVSSPPVRTVNKYSDRCDEMCKNNS
jgi:hypothetical protein